MALSFFDSGFGTIDTANITSDNQTEIGAWSEQQLIYRFKIYTDS